MQPGKQRESLMTDDQVLRARGAIPKGGDDQFGPVTGSPVMIGDVQFTLLRSFIQKRSALVSTTNHIDSYFRFTVYI